MDERADVGDEAAEDGALPVPADPLLRPFDVVDAQQRDTLDGATASIARESRAERIQRDGTGEGACEGPDQALRSGQPRPRPTCRGADDEA